MKVLLRSKELIFPKGKLKQEDRELQTQGDLFRRIVALKTQLYSHYVSVKKREDTCCAEHCL